LERLNQILKDGWVRPDTVEEETLKPLLTTPLIREYRLSEMLRRPEIGIADLMPLLENEEGFSPRALEQVEINSKYSGYLSRQQDEINKALKHETTQLPAAMDYLEVKGLSNEVRQKLQDVRPATIGQAGRISGITPAAISLLLVHLKRQPAVQKSA